MAWLTEAEYDYWLDVQEGRYAPMVTTRELRKSLRLVGVASNISGEFARANQAWVKRIVEAATDTARMKRRWYPGRFYA